LLQKQQAQRLSKRVTSMAMTAATQPVSLVHKDRVENEKRAVTMNWHANSDASHEAIDDGPNQETERRLMVVTNVVASQMDQRRRTESVPS
jgi:hypothetical protein